MYRKKTIFAILAASFFVLAGTASAQVGMMGNYWQNGIIAPPQSQDLNNVLESIYTDHNVTGQAEVICNKVTDDQFEKLGDAYMGAMLPNEQQHQAMENMMGGEGSASLRQAHINMGRSYIGCWSNYNSGPIYMPMLGSFKATNWPAMMGGYYGGYGSFGWITMFLIWAVLILGIATAVKWLRKK